MAIDRAFIRALAEANGLTIPENRLDVVLRQYQNYLQDLEKIDSVDQQRELEPAIDFSVDEPAQDTLIPGGLVGPGMMPRRMMRQMQQEMRRRR